MLDYPQARVTRLSEEHGEIDISKCETRPRIGDRVRIIPNHICPCVNLQDQVWLEDDEGNLQRVPVDARGRLS